MCGEPILRFARRYSARRSQRANDIAREGIRSLTMEQAQTAKAMGRQYKLVCQAERQPDGTVVGSVRPEQVPHDEPLAGCDGATSAILFQMYVIHGLTLSEIHPDAVTTAYGPLADFLTIAHSTLYRATPA